MEEYSTGGNRRRRSRQIYGEDNLKTISRIQINETNDAHADDNDDQLPLSLSLGSTSYSSQIRPMTSSPPLAPPSPFAPPMTTWPSPDVLARIASSQSYSMPPYFASSSLINSLYQTGPRGSSTPMQPLFRPAVNFFSASASVPSSSHTPTRPVRPITSAVEARRSFRSQSTENQKEHTITPPFPWATNKPGRIQSLEDLESKQITTITGDVQCKHCEKVYKISYNVREKFSEVKNIIRRYKMIMRERAHPNWRNPELARCELCGRDKAVKPVIAERKREINWLFMLLGQTLGYCTLEQLKNFCKHSKSHRTGAKDRVLYSTYMDLCEMLEPNDELFNPGPRQ